MHFWTIFINFCGLENSKRSKTKGPVIQDAPLEESSVEKVVFQNHSNIHKHYQKLSKHLLQLLDTFRSFCRLQHQKNQVEIQKINVLEVFQNDLKKHKTQQNLSISGIFWLLL